MYLVWLPEGTTRDQVGPLLLGPVADELLALDPRGLSMDLDDELADVAARCPPRRASTPSRRWCPSGSTPTTTGPLRSGAQRRRERLAGYTCSNRSTRTTGPPSGEAARLADGERSPAS